MAVQVAVVDPLPLFRDGAVAALTAAGHEVHTPSDVMAWARQVPRWAVLLTVLAEADWVVLAELSTIRSADRALVVLLAAESPAAGVRAVRAGARSVLGRGASAKVLRRTLSATLDGQAVLPAAVATALAACPHAGPAEGLTAERLSWLRSLAAGSTVRELASQAGYSERAMFRLLRALYRDIGASSRVEALMLAQGQGWLRLPFHGR